MKRLLGKKYAGYVLALVGIAFITVTLQPYHEIISPATIVLPMLLIVLFVATVWGSRPAMFASVIGVLCFNYFFLPPIHTFTISNPHNWVAFAAFLITAITAGQLSSYARHRAEEAESGRIEIERLYKELQDAFEKASHTEALRESEKLKSALLDAVTHDLRTPLTSIKASVTTLLDDMKTQAEFKLDKDGREEFLEIINEETDRLNHFIEGMVELARLEAGEMKLRRSWGAIDEIISAALERAAPRLEKHLITVELEKELPSVRVDAKALAEVIYTLLDNAAKYSPENSAVKMTAKRGQDEMVEFAIIDEGNSIPENMRESVFDKFFRASQSAEQDKHTQTGGIGWGLAIARGIVEAHGGRIWIEDNPLRKGTQVKFIVPVGDEEESSSLRV